MAYQPDWCIQNRVKQDNRYADAENYTKKIQDIAKNSEWHERQQKFEVARNNLRSEKSTAQELQIANRELKERRRFMLRQLLESENQLYEAELASKGLAIYRDY
jgi:Domain of unknown function (DUF4558)